jgi:hypothetical protein
MPPYGTAETHSLARDPVMPQGFDQKAGATAEHEDVARERIAAQVLLPSNARPASPCAHRYGPGRSISARLQQPGHRRARMASTPHSPYSSLNRVAKYRLSGGDETAQKLLLGDPNLQAM